MRYNSCPTCGAPKTPRSDMCRACWMTVWPNRIAEREQCRFDTIDQGRALGLTFDQIIDDVGTTAEALERWLYRRGRKDLARWVHGQSRMTA